MRLREVFPKTNSARYLFKAVLGNKINRVRKYLEKGGDINAGDDCGRTALTMAIYMGHKDIALLLLHTGIDVNKGDHMGYTALMCAAGYGRKEMVGILLDKGANPNAKTNKGKTALTYASEGNHLNHLYITYKLADHGGDEQPKPRLVNRKPASGSPTDDMCSVRIKKPRLL